MSFHTPKTIIFMGTPSFAVPALEALVQSPHRVVAVYTQPPKPAGRGMHITPSLVHQCAIQHGLSVETPSRLRDPDVQARFASYHADIVVVAAYGLLLPPSMLTLCPLGCINLHPSLLPRWRGAAPIQHSILAGDSRTAMCIMQMDEGMDTGPLLACELTPIAPTEDAVMLQARLATMGASLLIRTLATLDEEALAHATPQAQEGVTYASKLSKASGAIYWQQTAWQIACQIRAFTPWPGSYFSWKDQRIKLLEAHASMDAPPDSSRPVGTLCDDQGSIQCGTGMLRVQRVQPAGASPLSMTEWLRRAGILPGTLLGR